MVPISCLRPLLRITSLTPSLISPSTLTSSPSHTHSASFSTSSSSSSSPSTHCYVWGGGQGLSQKLSAVSSLFSSSSPPANTVAVTRPKPFTNPNNDSNIAAISFGTHHNAILLENGDVYTYGSGKNYELGLGKKLEKVSKPTKVPGLPPIKQVFAGEKHTIFLSTDGEVFTTGSGGSYFESCSLGHGNKSDAPVPTLVRGLPKIAEISSGSHHCLARTSDGKVYAWGKGENGRLGTGGSSDQSEPVYLNGFDNIVIQRIVSASSFNGAIDSEGGVWTFGRNDKGQLGVGIGMSMDQYSMEPAPVKVEFSDAAFSINVPSLVISELAIGNNHMLALTKEGRCMIWGSSLWTTPSVVRGDDDIMLKQNIKMVAGGNQFSAAANDDGYLLTWGKGVSGALGHGGVKSSKSPHFVRGFGPDLESSGAASQEEYYGKVKKVFAAQNYIAVLAEK